MLLLFEKNDSGVREEHDARERENVLIAVPCGDEKISIMMKIEWRYWQTQINEICRLRGDTYLFKASESGIFFSETTFDLSWRVIFKNRKTKKIGFLIDYFISEPRVFFTHNARTRTIDVSYSFLRSCLFRRIPYILEIDRVRLREEDPIEKKWFENRVQGFHRERERERESKISILKKSNVSWF